MAAPEKKPRVDKRKTLLLYLDPTLIALLKKRAIDEEKHTYQVAEEILLGRSEPVSLGGGSTKSR